MSNDSDFKMISPPNEGPITHLWAYLSEDATGDGIIAMQVAGIGWAAAVTGRERVAELMKTGAVMVGKLGNMRVKLVRFKVDEVLEVFDP